MSKKPKFNPNKPFEEVNVKPKFDPSKESESAEAPVEEPVEDPDLLDKLAGIPGAIADTASSAVDYLGRSISGEIPLSEQLDRAGTLARGAGDAVQAIGDLPAQGISKLLGLDYEGAGAKETAKLLDKVGAGSMESMEQSDAKFPGARGLGQALPLMPLPLNAAGIVTGAGLGSYGAQVADKGSASAKDVVEDIAVGGVLGAGTAGISKALNAPAAAKDIIRQRLMQKGEGVGAKFVDNPEALKAALDAPNKAARLQGEIASIDVGAAPQLNEMASGITNLKSNLDDINAQIESLNLNKQELTLADKRKLNDLNFEKQLKTDELLAANQANLAADAELQAAQPQLRDIRQQKFDTSMQKKEASLGSKAEQDALAQEVRAKKLELNMVKMGQKQILDDFKAGKIQEANAKIKNAWEANEVELAEKGAKVNEMLDAVEGFVPVTINPDLDAFYNTIRANDRIPFAPDVKEKLIADLKQFIGRDEKSLTPSGEFLKNVKDIKSHLQQKYYDIANPRANQAGIGEIAKQSKILFDNIAKKMGAEEAATLNSSMRANYNKRATLKNFGKMVNVDQQKQFAPSASRLENATSPELLAAGQELGLAPGIKSAVSAQKQELASNLQQQQAPIDQLEQSAFNKYLESNNQQRNLEQQLIDLTREENKINGQLPMKNVVEARRIQEELKRLSNESAKIQTSTQSSGILPLEEQMLGLSREAQGIKIPLKDLMNQREQLKQSVASRKIPLVSQKHAENLKSMDINQLKGIDLQDRGILDAVTSGGIVPQVSKGIIRELVNPVRQIQAYNGLVNNVGAKAAGNMLQTGRQIATGTGKALSSYTAISPNDDWNTIKDPSVQVSAPLKASIKALANSGKPFTMEVVTALAKQHKVDPKVILAYIGK